jgi:hypothetical protein
MCGDESRRPYRTAGLWVFGYPGFHPGLFSLAPSGSNGEAWRVVGRARKVPVSVRLDPLVLDWLRGKGEGSGGPSYFVGCGFVACMTGCDAT